MHAESLQHHKFSISVHLELEVHLKLWDKEGRAHPRFTLFPASLMVPGVSTCWRVGFDIRPGGKGGTSANPRQLSSESQRERNG